MAHVKTLYPQARLVGIADGAKIILVGLSGIGKTTALNAILQQYPQTIEYVIWGADSFKV